MKYLKKLNEKNYNFKGVDKVKLYLFIFIAGAFAGYIYEVIFESVFTFAIGGMLLIYIVEPLIKEFISTKSKKITNIISIVFIVIFVIDALLSFLIRNKI